MFKPSEYQKRLKRLQQCVEKSGLDAFIVATDTNIIYLTGMDFHSIERPLLMVVPASGEPSLVVPRMEQEQLSAAATVDNLLVYWELESKLGRGWKETLYEALGPAKSVGIDPFAELNIISALSNYQWQVSDLLEDLRVIKSKAEVAWTRQVAHHWTDIMNAMLSKAKVGVALGELMSVAGEITREIISSEPHSNFINTRSVQFYQCAPKSGSPHHFSYRIDEVLPNGPTIINAVGAISHYNAENERTILAGDYTAQHAELFDLAQKGQQLALDLIRPGVPCAEVDCAVQNFFDKEGVKAHLRHRTGHGFGLLPHERPYTSEGSEESYRPNMIVSVEPGLYVDGVGGFRHSDTVLVTEDGIENFTAGTAKDRMRLTFQ